jgi:hypothetical protein
MTEMTGKTTLNLYRSIHKTTPGYDNGPIVDGAAVTGVLYPDFERRQIGKNKFRAADLTTFDGEGGVRMVRNDGGTSLFDKPDVLPGGATNWHRFKLPPDTVIPPSLKIRFTGHNKTFDADHHQIESVAGTMAMDAMKGALDNLARNAIVRLIALGETAAPAVKV